MIANRNHTVKPTFAQQGGRGHLDGKPTHCKHRPHSESRLLGMVAAGLKLADDGIVTKQPTKRSQKNDTSDSTR